MKRLALLFVLVPALLSAGEFLGIVPGARPEDLAARFTIVGMTRNGVLVVGDDAAFDLAGGTRLDANPRDNLYVRAYPLDEAARAELLTIGTILDFDGEEYLVRVTPAEAERLRGVRMMSGPVNLKGWVLNDRVPSYAPVTLNPLIEAMVAVVHPDSVLGYVRRLQDYGNRYSTGDSCMAAAGWIRDRFMAYGCDTVIHQYHRSGHAPNVIGIRYGTSGARDVYALIGGHFDAYASSNAPGADDNASGTAAAIEACRATQNHLFTHDLYYVGFSGEEFGLYGSQEFAERARQRGDSILGVLNFDMIGYVDTSPEDLDLMGKINNPPCEPFVDWFIAIADTYTTLPCNKRMMEDNHNQDAGSFWDEGYIALTGIEDFWPSNPHYHTSHDSIGAGYNNNAFCTEVTRAGVAALATLGEPVPLNQPLLGLTRSRFDDAGGNNNGRWDAGETVDLYLTLKNFGMVEAHSVTATVSSRDTFITIGQPNAGYGDIPGQDTAVNSVPFEATAVPGTPREHVAHFELEMVSAESTWNGTFSIVVGEYFTTDPIPDGPRTPARYWAYDDVDTGYTQTPVYDWVEINQTGTRLDYPHNDDVIGVDLPPGFGTFRFYGQDYTRLSISADGWICPGAYTQRHYSNRGLPDPQNPPGLICPNWDDLYPGHNSQGYVYWHHDAGNHRFIVEYDSVAYYDPRTVRDKHQVIFYDSTVVTPTGDNAVVVQYMTANRFTGSTVGIQDPTRAIAIQDLFNGALAGGAAPIAAGRAIKFITLDPTGLQEHGPGARRPARLSVSANPLRPGTTVRFSLANPGPVELAVFDRSGRKIGVLLSRSSGSLEPGTHTLTWDTSRLAHGVYFLRLDADGTTETVKATVIR